MNIKYVSKRLAGTLAAALLLGGGAGNALAAGTASGTTISNQASVDYQVNTIAQPTQSSNIYQFVVDNKVDLVVSIDDLAVIAVTPGSTGNVMTFTVTNNGNTAQDFSLSAAALIGGTGIFGGTDNINADTVQVFVETNATLGYQAADTDIHINALAPDTSIKVYMVSSFNTGYADGDVASYYLVAEARTNDGAGTLGAALTQTVGGDTEGSVDIVFADGDGDGALGNDINRDAKHASQNDYEVSAANLSIAKSSSVVSDPFNSTINPKRIPGAIVEYTITVSNAGGTAAATNIAISDNLNTEIATNSTLAFNTQYDATAGQGIVVAYPGNGNVNTEFTNANDGAEDGTVSVDWNVTGTNTVTVSGISLAAGESADVIFQVTIQ